jgi:hypothetical protein
MTGKFNIRDTEFKTLNKKVILTYQINNGQATSLAIEKEDLFDLLLEVKTYCKINGLPYD